MNAKYAAPIIKDLLEQIESKHPDSGVYFRYTKKMGQQILRTQDRAAIFDLYRQLTGRIDRGEIYEFIKNFAPTKKVAKAAHSIAFGDVQQL